MSVEGQAQPLGITVAISTPAAIATPQWIMDLRDNLTGYNHQIAAIGGYASATIAVRDNLANLEAWIADGLGRHVEVYSPNTDLIWEGFVNVMRLNVGGSTIERGPLMDIANRVSVMYTPIIDPTTDPPSLGTKTETTIANNTASQTKYGILERVLSSGNLLDDGVTNDAEYVRDLFLAENKEARNSNEISLAPGGSGDVTLTLDCRGYFDWLNAYVYNDGTHNFSVQIDDKLGYVLTADPNALFSTAYDWLDANAALTQGLEDENRTAMTVIKELLALGDINDNRYLFGFYGGIKPKYNVVPTSIEYYYYRHSKAQSIETPSGERVRPWDVLPGKWVLIPDLMAGHAYQDNLRLDPRTLFIENVNYNAPYGVNLQGSPILNLPQMLARLGVGGV